jgi:hypothetical protein
MQHVDVPPLEPKDLTQAEMTPRRQLDGYPPWLGHGIGKGIHLGDAQHGPFGRALLPRSLDHARVPSDQLVGHCSAEDPTKEAVSLRPRLLGTRQPDRHSTSAHCSG